MADYEYFGSGQFNQMLEQRPHDDKFFSEIIRMGAAFDKDIGEFVIDDIVGGNTHTLGSFYRRQKQTNLEVNLINGSLLSEANQNYGPITDHTLYSMIPIKDDYSTAQGVNSYEALQKDDQKRKDTDKMLRALNMDWETATEDIVDPPPIGAVGTPEFKKYQKMWDDSESLQADYPTIEAYHNQLVKDWGEQQEGIKNLTDIYIGMYVTGNTIAEANTIALYFTAASLYPKVTHNPSPTKVKNFPSQSYMFEYQCGTFTAVCGWSGWSHIIRSGLVENKFEEDAGKWKKKKSNFKFYWKEDARKNAVDGDPIVQILQSNILEGNWSRESMSGNGTGMLELQVQLTPTTYGEIRIWDYGTLHVVTGKGGLVALYASISNPNSAGMGGDTDLASPEEYTVPDDQMFSTQLESENPMNDQFSFEEGYDEAYFSLTYDGILTSNAPLDYSIKKTYYLRIEISTIEMGVDSVHSITINVENTNSEPEPPEELDPFETLDTLDEGYYLVFFPIEYKAAKQVPLFKRERLIRETVNLGIYSIEKVKIEWYQKGWFKVVIFIVAVVIAIVSGPAGWAGLLSLQTIITTAFTLAISGLVATALAKAFAGDSWLLKVIIIAIMIYAGNYNQAINMSSFISLATNAMNAAGNLISIYYQQKMAELQEEMLEWQEQMKSEQLELERLMQQAGGLNRSDASDLTTFLATLAPSGESPDGYLDRTTNVENATIDSVEHLSDVTTMWPDMIKN